MDATTTFINVDLDLLSAEDLVPLAEALGPQLFVLHVRREGRWHRATLEVAAYSKTVDGVIRRLVAAILKLPKPHRARWNRATRRDFNVGIQAEGLPHASYFPIESGTVALVAKVGGRIVITVYGASSPTDGRRQAVVT